MLILLPIISAQCLPLSIQRRTCHYQYGTFPQSGFFSSIGIWPRSGLKYLDQGAKFTVFPEWGKFPRSGVKFVFILEFSWFLNGFIIKISADSLFKLKNLPCRLFQNRWILLWVIICAIHYIIFCHSKKQWLLFFRGGNTMVTADWRLCNGCCVLSWIDV